MLYCMPNKTVRAKTVLKLSLKNCSKIKCQSRSRQYINYIQTQYNLTLSDMLHIDTSFSVSTDIIFTFSGVWLPFRRIIWFYRFLLHWPFPSWCPCWSRFSKHRDEVIGWRGWGMKWLGGEGGGCARGLIRRRLLPDVCSCCLSNSRNASVSATRRMLFFPITCFLSNIWGLAILKKLKIEAFVYRT